MKFFSGGLGREEGNQQCFWLLFEIALGEEKKRNQLNAIV